MSRAPALRAPRRRSCGPEPRAASQPFRRSSTGAGEALQLLTLPPKSVRLLGYNEYRTFFMPLGWEETRARQAAGYYVSDPAGWAHQAAGLHAFDALHRPHIAAADAIAFCARCVASWGIFHVREAAE